MDEKKTRIPAETDIEDTKQRLTGIREYTRDNLGLLFEELRASLKQKYPKLKVKLASDDVDAANYIAQVSGSIKIIATNNSSVVNEELKPELEANGFTVINTYLNEFDVAETKINHYWDLPSLLNKNLGGTFEVSARLTGIAQPGLPDKETKKYLAVLGVNAVSAEDATVFFVQHFHNIHNVLKEAQKVILIVGLDKIVKTRDDAAFQARCMGIFGIEGIPLDIRPKPEGTLTLDEIPIPAVDEDRELHMIVMDNGRTRQAGTRFNDLSLCIGCRACTGSCPAYISGKPLTPRTVILNFKKHLPGLDLDLLESISEGEPPSGDFDAAPVREVITKDEIWACTTCRACHEACPVGVKPVEPLLTLRQDLVMTQTVVPKTAETALRSVEARGHPWRGTTFSRIDWAESLDIKILSENSDVDILYWVGCTEALEERSVKVAQAIARLLKLAGVNFGILGPEETCCGDPACHLGNEYLFRLLTEKNIEMLKNYSVKRIVTGCPHCYNTLKYEYPKFGGDFEVQHHTELIASLLEEGKLKFNKNDGDTVITYHDPCYLGRYHGVYELPRRILSNLPDAKVIEIERNRDKSFCCGGGGGRMWLEENIGRRISEMRIEGVIETKAQIVATACPYCLQMFDDAIKAKDVQESLAAMDIAELVAGLAIRSSY